VAYCESAVIRAKTADWMRSAFGGQSTGVLGSLITAGVVILFGGGLAVTLYAASEWIDLFLGLEETTRITAQALQLQAGQELSEFSSQRPGAGGQQPPISNQQVPES